MHCCAITRPHIVTLGLMYPFWNLMSGCKSSHGLKFPLGRNTASPMCSLPQLVNISDGFLTLLKDNGDLREDLRLPEGDLGKEIENKFEANEDIMVSSSLLLNRSFLLLLHSTAWKSMFFSPQYSVTKRSTVGLRCLSPSSHNSSPPLILECCHPQLACGLVCGLVCTYLYFEKDDVHNTCVLFVCFSPHKLQHYSRKTPRFLHWAYLTFSKRITSL